MNDYVAGGYAALAAIIGLYVIHLRRRAGVLAKALPPRPDGGISVGPHRRAEPEIHL